MAEINDLNVTDASNTARFPENQAPSSVNDGARALEGLLARWHKDTNATIAAGGTGDAITVAANQTLSAYYDGLVIAFEATAANTTATTLNVDSVGAKAIRKNFNIPLVANDIKNGQKVICIFDSSADYWQMITHLGNQTVSGPASATADSLAKWNGTTGGLLKDGAVIGTDVLGVAIDGTPDTDHTSTGLTTNTFASSGSTTVMDLVYLNSSSEWALTDADAAATAGPVRLAISLETKTAGQAMKVALPGSFVRDDTWNWTPGAVLYVSETAGQISASVPTGVDGIVRIVGHAVTADVIFFNPSDDYVTIDASGTIKNVSGIAPAAVSTGLTLGTEQATTSGSSVTFTGIPAGTKIIIVSFIGVSMTANNTTIAIQIGDAGGLETTGYVGGVQGNNVTPSFVFTDFSASFLMAGASGATIAGSNSNGQAILVLENSTNFTWSMQGQLMPDANAGGQYHNRSAGRKALSAELTQLSVLTDGTFDAGAVNIAYL